MTFGVDVGNLGCSVRSSRPRTACEEVISAVSRRGECIFKFGVSVEDGDEYFRTISGHQKQGSLVKIVRSCGRRIYTLGVRLCARRRGFSARNVVLKYRLVRLKSKPLVLAQKVDAREVGWWIPCVVVLGVAVTSNPEESVSEFRAVDNY